MSSADRALDIRYGRQGGRRTTQPAGRLTVTPCPACGAGMILGQLQSNGRHYICSPACGKCFRRGNACQCAGGPTPLEAP
jgi:hypothetical protein